MPELSRFFGIVIVMHYNEHGAPHFHAKYAGQRASFSITDPQLTEGRLSRRAAALVLEWSFEHRDELLADWELARSRQPLRPILPLE